MNWCRISSIHRMYPIFIGVTPIFDDEFFMFQHPISGDCRSTVLAPASVVLSRWKRFFGIWCFWRKSWSICDLMGYCGMLLDITMTSKNYQRHICIKNPYGSDRTVPGGSVTGLWWRGGLLYLREESAVGSIGSDLHVILLMEEILHHFQRPTLKASRS